MRYRENRKKNQVLLNVAKSTTFHHENEARHTESIRFELLFLGYLNIYETSYFRADFLDLHKSYKYKNSRTKL